MDDEPQRLKLAEKRARREGVVAQLDPIGREITSRSATLQEAAEAGRMRIDEANARFLEAKAIADLRALEAKRSVTLKKEGFVTVEEVERTTATAKAARATTEALERARARAEAEYKSQTSAIAGEIAALERQQGALRAEQATLEAELKTLEREIAYRKIRSPIAGRIGEVFGLRTGAFVDGGDIVATVVPTGNLRAVAEFSLSSVGRLEAGQSARMRLDAFPWTEFGTIPAEVHAIATEAKNGRVRVELALGSASNSAIPIQHGLTGLAIVEVEQVAPWTLVLRAAGHRISRPSENDRKIP